MTNTGLWNREKLHYRVADHNRHFPTEYVLRSILSPRYFNSTKPIEEGQKILDIGCLYANNLLPFADRGCALFGAEVTEDSVEIARESAVQQGVDLCVEQGTNRSLPFADEMFDFVLSINTIHYENFRDNVILGLQEMRRVLKSDGCLLIATAGRRHDFVRTALKTGPNSYTVQMEGDFRDGTDFSFFESQIDFEEALASVFGNAETAVVTESYPNTSLEFYVGKCYGQDSLWSFESRSSTKGD